MSQPPIAAVFLLTLLGFWVVIKGIARVLEELEEIKETLKR